MLLALLARASRFSHVVGRFRPPISFDLLIRMTRELSACARKISRLLSELRSSRAFFFISSFGPTRAICRGFSVVFRGDRSGQPVALSLATTGTFVAIDNRRELTSRT